MVLNVTKRNGSHEPINLEKIHKVLFWATEGLKGVSVSEIELRSQIQFFNHMKSKDIHEIMIKAAADLISEESPNYQYVAGRLVNYQLRKEVYGGYSPNHIRDIVERNADAGYYDPALLGYYTDAEWNEINNFIEHQRDENLTYAAMEQLRGKYLVQNRVTGEIRETPQVCYALIAATLFHTYPVNTRMVYVRDYYTAISKHDISLPTPVMAGVRTAERQFSSCFPAGQKVWTTHGFFPIEEVAPGEMVLTRSGAYHPVIATRKKPNEERLVSFATNLSFENVVATESHPIYAIKRRHSSSRKNFSVPEWVEAGKLENGDYVHIAVNKDITPREKINISDFIDLESVGYGIDNGVIRKRISNPSRSIYNGREWSDQTTLIPNTIHLTPDLFRLFGYFLAEGHIHADMTSTHFTFGTHETNYISDVLTIVKDTFGYACSVKHNSDNSTGVAIHSRVVSMFFKAMCGNGFDRKFMHPILIKAEVEKQKELLIGVIRGDGCVHANGMTLGMSNEQLIMQLAHISIRCGCFPAVHLREPSGKATAHRRHNGSITVCQQKTTTYILWLARGPNYNFITAIGKNANKVVKSSCNKYSISKFIDGEFYTKVRHITILGYNDCIVYDLQVDNDQSFTVFGVSAHNCTLIEVSDSLGSINAASAAIINYVSQKAGIGLGAGRIRALGSPIRNGAVSHTGVTPFFKHFQTAVNSCNQGGVRKGSATLYYPIWHYEIENLIVLKNNKGTEETRVRQLDYGIQFNKLFYERLIQGGDITLFSPNDVREMHDAFFADYDKFKLLYEAAEKNTRIRKKKIKAIDLFTSFIQERKDTGRIYLQNVDNANQHSPFKPDRAPITMSNLCAEIDLPTIPMASIEKRQVKIHKKDLARYFELSEDEAITVKGIVSEDDTFLTLDIEQDKSRIALCILSAINWGNIKTPADFQRPCELAVRGLDALIDYQTYPVAAAALATREFRPIGVGIINLAYWMAKHDLRYSDGSALVKLDEYAEAWSYYLLRASVDLAKEKGSCPRFDDLKYADGILPIDTRKMDVDALVPHVERMEWDGLRADVKVYGIRNATTMACMPAETSAQCANATNGIEPPRALVSVKQSKHGVLKQVVPEIKKLKNKYELLWDQKSPEGYLQICAVLQKYIDQGISVNTSYNPAHYPNEKIGVSELLKHILMFYKFGGKQMYYNNTNDGAGEIDIDKMSKGSTDSDEDGDDCESCTL